jgi:hypothetical protein
MHLSGIKIYYKTSIIKILWYWHMNRQIAQFNTESSEIVSSTFGNLDFIKVVPQIIKAKMDFQ